MTEAELRDAYRSAARADLDDDREPATGVPLDVHAELRELRHLVELMARELATLRELAELFAAVLGVDLEAPCDDCGQPEGLHDPEVEH